MTDETTPETNVTIGMLEKLLAAANSGAHRGEAAGCGFEGRYAAAALATGIVLGEVRRLIPPRIPTPTPAPKFKERDWVVQSYEEKAYVDPWQIKGLSAWQAGREGDYLYGLKSVDGKHGQRYESALLPIPPKPDKVQAGYRLTGRVLGPDERTKESYWVLKEPDEHGVHAVTQSTGKGIVGCGERRWEAELVPALKLKERDWVQHKNTGAIWRIVGLSATSVPLMYRVESADGLVGDMYEEFVLPIPPKPDKVQAGYRLRGDVKVADGSEPFIIAFGVNAGRVATCTVDMTVFGGRRWIVELDPACPHCKDTHVCPHCKENAT